MKRLTPQCVLSRWSPVRVRPRPPLQNKAFAFYVRAEGAGSGGPFSRCGNCRPLRGLRSSRSSLRSTANMANMAAPATKNLQLTNSIRPPRVRIPVSSPAWPSLHLHSAGGPGLRNPAYLVSRGEYLFSIDISREADGGAAMPVVTIWRLSSLLPYSLALSSRSGRRVAPSRAMPANNP